MDNLIHIALADDGVVMAQFVKSEDAAVFCKQKNYCHMPFNPTNTAKTPVPAVGTKYICGEVIKFNTEY